jgi:hypothetical protein
MPERMGAHIIIAIVVMIRLNAAYEVSRILHGSGPATIFADMLISRA